MCLAADDEEMHLSGSYEQREGLSSSKAREYMKLSGRGRAGSKNPSSSALAQRRYHQRQKVHLISYHKLHIYLYCMKSRLDIDKSFEEGVKPEKIIMSLSRKQSSVADFILQAKKLEGERQLYDLSQRMEELMQEKKELELKNKILVKDLITWQDHVEELWGREVCCLRLPLKAQ